jgi:Flp pilus assembly protein TadG
MFLTLKQFTRCQRGATAVEFGIIALPMLLVTLGTIEFGRALFTRNDMAQTLDRVERQILIGKTLTDQQIIDQLKDAKFTSATAGATQTISGVNYRTLTITQDLKLLIPFQDSSFQIVVERRVRIS